MLQDFRYGPRVLSRGPAFTALKPLQAGGPSRLVSVILTDDRNPRRATQFDPLRLGAE